MTKKQNLLISFILAGLIFALDQFTKRLVVANIAPGDSWQPFPAIGRFLRIIHTGNTGVAFGMFQGNSNLFTVIAVIAVAGIAFYIIRESTLDRLTAISLGLMLGGAAGNLLDRLTYGHVIDFIDVRYSDSLVWPTFNVADSSLVLGVGVLLVALWLEERRLRQYRTPPDGDDWNLAETNQHPE